jgi:hypothetical protein
LWISVLNANMGAMARSLSAKERARVGAIVPGMAAGRRRLISSLPTFPEGER